MIGEQLRQCFSTVTLLAKAASSFCSGIVKDGTLAAYIYANSSLPAGGAVAAVDIEVFPVTAVHKAALTEMIILVHV